MTPTPAEPFERERLADAVMIARERYDLLRGLPENRRFDLYFDLQQTAACVTNAENALLAYDARNAPAPRYAVVAQEPERILVLRSGREPGHFWLAGDIRQAHTFDSLEAAREAIALFPPHPCRTFHITQITESLV